MLSSPAAARVAQTPRAVAGFIAARDHRLMKHVNGWRPPRWFRLWMVCATRGGDGWLWYALGVYMLLFGGGAAWMAVAAAAVAGGAGAGAFLWLKRTCNRTRPCAIEPHCWATLLPPDQFSFPSGHSIMAFSVAVAIGMFYPALLPGLIFCASSVAVSRILLGMHFLSDVIAGSAIGAALGYAAFAVFSR